MRLPVLLAALAVALLLAPHRAAADPLDPAPAAAPPVARLEPGQPLTEEIAAGLVESALRAEGESAERLEIAIDSPALPLPNRAGRPADLRLTGLRAEPRTGRFTARLEVTLESGEAGRIDLAGRARRMVRLPVPAHRLERGGGVIAAEDLEERWLPEAQLPPDVLRDSADLIGKEARHVLLPGGAVRGADLAAPRLVDRGDLVTMSYSEGGLELSTVGEALDAGAEGDAVRLVNPDSKLVRKGIVTGRRLVRVLGTREGAS